MKTQFRRFARAAAGFSLVLLGALALGQTEPGRDAMLAPRLEAMQGVQWNPLSSPQKTLLHVESRMAKDRTQLKLIVPGYGLARVREDDVEFVRVDVPGAGITPTVGQPELPVVRRFVAVPEGANVSLKIKTGKALTLENVHVYPVQEPLPEQAGTAERKFAFAREFYQLDRLYPAQLVTVSEPMKLRNVTVVLVEVAVMQYNGAKKTLSVYPNLDVELSFSKPFTKKPPVLKPGALLPKETGTVVAPAAPTEEESAPGAENEFKPESANVALLKPYHLDTSTLVVNWDWVKDHISPVKWHYLIITPDAYHNDILPLAKWKQTKGLFVHVTKVSTIGAAPTATQIRDYIKTAYENHAVEYVLLVGDTDTVPGYGYTGGGGTITDYYYTLVDGTDYLPDLALGRFSGRSSAEITNLVNKTVNYEKTPTTGSWQSHALCISDSGYFETTSNHNSAALLAHGFSVENLYASLGNATAANVTNSINNGRLVVSYRGHGSQIGWVTTGFNNANVTALTNGAMLPVIISPTCLTGCYDYAASDCFAETWAKANEAAGPLGAITYWGSARVSYGGYNDELSKGAFDDMLGGDHVIGNVVNNAKLQMISVYGVGDSTCLLELHMFNLFGDPNLDISF
jgi:hypothetical protein